MKWTKSPCESFWTRECGRYTICRSLAWDKNPNGHWIHLAWFKRAPGEIAECISAERRETFEDAVEDCTAHIQQCARAAA